jgi:hypothetical protein
MARSLGAERAEPAPQGSGELESTPLGSGDAAVMSSNHLFNFDRWGP